MISVTAPSYSFGCAQSVSMYPWSGVHGTVFVADLGFSGTDRLF